MFLVCLHGCKYVHRSSHVELELSLLVMFLNGMNHSMLMHLRMLVLGYQHEQPLQLHHELHLDNKNDTKRGLRNKLLGLE